MRDIYLDDGYTLRVYNDNDWDLIRSDGTKVIKINLPVYVGALVKHIIKFGR